jgi:hypothetical protein
MNLLQASAATLTLALAGIGLLWILWPPICGVPPTVRLSLGFCVGCFLETVCLFLAFLFGAPFSRYLTLAPIIGFGVLGAVAMARGGWSRPQFSLAGFLAVLLVLLALVLSWGRPVYDWDALAMWALRAKVTFFAKTWPTTLFDSQTTIHPDYPPLVPSAQALIFFWLNRFDDVASRVVFAAFFASAAAILWWWLGVFRVSARCVWLLWWSAVPVLMEQVKSAYADLPLAVFLVVFYGATIAWLREPRRRDWLRLAAIFGGIAFWVKQDALIGVGSGFLALLLVARCRRLPLGPIVLSIMIAVALALPWRLLLWGRQYQTDFGFLGADWGRRASLVGEYLFRIMVVERYYAFFWPLFVVTLVLCARRLRRVENLWLAASLVIEAAAVFALYVCLEVNLEWALKTSVERVLVNLFVPALLLVSLLWRGSFAVLRRVRWQRWSAVGTALLAVSMSWIGFHRRRVGELFGLSISALPRVRWTVLALGTTVLAVITILKFWPTLRRGRVRVAWRAMQFAVVVATFGIAAVSVGVYAREAGELRRRFGEKTLAEQYAVATDPLVRERLVAAWKQFPTGTHVRVFPKHSLPYYEFNYEAFPDLIVDDSAEQAVDLSRVVK